ncbi:MAG: hypothetical protein J3Q66DRAFT_412498, partial [Benniella sp.]
MPEGSTTQHEIHMAKHEGYDIDKPNEFFEKYGSYILALMYMVKYGIMAAGVVVPPLASSKVMDGLDTAEKHMDYLKKNIGPLVDDSIAFLQDHKSTVADDISKNGDPLQLEKLEVLEGADLRQLESYLKAKDKHRVLDNLYRIVTHEGYVKWVCIDHYRVNYRESASEGLREIVDLHKGSFMEDLGSIQIELGSYTRAKQFYNALMNSRGVHKLDITLAWDVTMSELQKLAGTVEAANIVDLTIDGTFFQGPARDVINRNKRYDPIMQIASNGRIQSLTLIGFKNMPQRQSLQSAAVAALLSNHHGLETLDINNDFLLTQAVVTQGRITAFKVKIRAKVDVLDVFYDLVEVLRANPFLCEITIDFHTKFVPVVIDLISARLGSKKTALRRVVLQSTWGEPAIIAEFEDDGGIPDVSVSVNIEDVRPWFEIAFPTRLAFPNLVSLKVLPAQLVSIKASPCCVQWISAMTSAAATKQAPLLTSSSLSEMTLWGSSDLATNTLKTWSPLKRLILRYVDLEPRDWAVVIEDLDFSALQELDLSHTNFSLKELVLLVRSVGKVDLTLPLRFLGLAYTQLRKREDMPQLQAASDALKEKAPGAMVEF